MRHWITGRRRVALVLALSIPVLAAVLVVWQASRALRDTAGRVRSEGEIRSTTARLDRPAPAGVEWVSAPAVYRDAVSFRGHLYVAGPAGLFEYDPQGAVLARYRVGLELPAAPLVSLAVAEPELVIATSGEGLLLFDGRGFRQVRPEDADCRRLTAVLPLPTGRILLGTEQRGLLVYDGKQMTPFHANLLGLHVTALAGDDASLWVGTLDRGVLHWHAGEIDRFGEAEGLPDPQVLSITVAGESAFIGTPLGVAEFRSGRFTRTLAAGIFARSLLVRGETLVAGTLDEGTVEISLSARPGRAPRPNGDAMPSPVVRLLEMDRALYALAEDGLYTAAGQQVLEHDGAILTDRNISALALDGAGRLWVGYFDRGLDIVELGAARAVHIEDDHLSCINRIVYDAQRGAAVATANGLALFDPSAKLQQVLGPGEGLIANHVTDVLLGPSGMTVATPAGLTFIDAFGARSLYAFHGLVNNHVYTLAASGDRVLAGTLGGLSILERGVVRASYTTANSGLKHNYITSIAPVDNEWFVGTYGRGILRLDSSGQWQTFPDATGPFEVNPNAMAVTPSRVYAGTLGRGLYVYDRGSGRWSVLTAGLPSTNVTAIAAGNSVLYVGTDNGLVRMPQP